MFAKSKINLKKFLISLLSMLMAVMLAFSIACNDGNDGDDGITDDGDNSTTTTTQITDYQLIKNGDFEFGSTDKTTYPLSSSISWTKSMGADVTTAPSSKGSSGIIDTESSAFDKLSEKNKPSVNPKTPGSFNLLTNEYDYEDEDKRSNPQVNGSKILMINNNNVNSNDVAIGTAQHYKATSTVSVGAGSHSIVTLWINTAELKSIYTDTPGAFIKISSSVNSKAYDDLFIRGINTNGEWAQFAFAIKGSRIASTTVGVTVGLGEGNGTDQNEFVNGFVFLDNVHAKSVTKKEYEDFVGEMVETDEYSTKKVTLPSTYVDNESQTETVKYSKVSVKLNYDQEELNGALLSSENVVFANAVSNYEYNPNGVNKKGVGDKATATANLPEGVIGENVNGFEKFVYMNFTSASSATYKTEEISVIQNSYVYVSFYAKVKANNTNADKLNVKIIDKNSGEDAISLFEAIETSSVENEELDNWVKYQAFINNPTDKDTKVELQFTFGYDKVFSDAHALQTGYAVVADLKFVSANEDLYNLASVNDNLVKKQVYGEYISYSKVTASQTEDDVYGVLVDKSQTFTIMEKPATNFSSYAFKSTITDSNNLTYGIINTKYYNESTGVYGKETTFTNSATEIENLKEINNLKEASNKYAQMIVVANKVQGYSRFVTSPYTVTKETQTKVNVKVKAYGDAKAYVSLVSSSLNDDKEYDAVKFEVNNESKTLTSTVTSSSYTKNGWTIVSFYISAGNEDVEFRVQVSNGSKTANSQGVVLFDGVSYATVDQAKISADKSALKLNFGSLTGEGYAFDSISHTRAPSTVKEDGADGEVIENKKYYLPTEVYLGNNYVKFVDYSTIFADEVIDNTTPSDDSSNEETKPEEEGYKVGLDVTLQISSIIISVVLLGVIATIIIRDVLKKRAKRKAKTQSYYQESSTFDRNSREKTLKKIAEKKSKIALASDEDEYDYEAAQNVNEEDGEVIEETVEEVVEVEEPTEDIAEEVTETENEPSNE